jgi:Lon protease-like protein
MRASVRRQHEIATPLTSEYENLVSVLRDLLAHPLVQELDPQADLNEDRSVGYRLADLLPIAPELKQWLLELGDPAERLHEVQEIIQQISS